MSDYNRTLAEALAAQDFDDCDIVELVKYICEQLSRQKGE